MNKIYNSEKEYYDDHECCPKCGSAGLSSTLVGYIFFKGRPFKNENKRKCSCGWEGITHDLVRRYYD